jgi:hypothetical protein
MEVISYPERNRQRAASVSFHDIVAGPSDRWHHSQALDWDL